MKLFRKLAAAALAGVMALSLLTGCALGDAAKENAMLKALQTIGNSYQVKVSESDSLSKKASGIFAKFKEAGEEAWDVENLPDDFSPTGKKVTYNDVEYMIVVLKMPKNAKTKAMNPIKTGFAANIRLSSSVPTTPITSNATTSNGALLTDTPIPNANPQPSCLTNARTARKCTKSASLIWKTPVWKKTTLMFPPVRPAG